MIGAADGIERVLDYARSVSAAAIVAADNTHMSWLARHRRLFEPGCLLLMPNEDVLTWAGSKRAQIGLAKQVGFDVLPSVCLRVPSDCRRVTDDLYPVVLRPDRRYKGMPPFKVKLAYSRKVLEEIVAAWCSVCGPLIAQPFLSLPNLVVHGARSQTGQILAMTAFLVPRKFETITLTMTPAAFPPKVEHYCREFVARAGITGCFHFEFLLCPQRQQAWFLEINVRLGGTTDKVTALGFDEPVYLLQAYGLAADAVAAKATGRRVAANRRALLKHMIWALTGRLTESDYPMVGRGRAALQSLRDICLVKDSIFDFHDMRAVLGIKPRIGEWQ
jgi:hypothetical protein